MLPVLFFFFLFVNPYTRIVFPLIFIENGREGKIGGRKKEREEEREGIREGGKEVEREKDQTSNPCP